MNRSFFLPLMRRAAPTVAAALLLLAGAFTGAAHAGDALAATLEAVRARHDLPALGAARVEREAGVTTLAVAGVRRRGATEAVTTEDRWHIGSCGKAMTATLAGLLIDAGKLSRDATLAQALPKPLAAKAREEYRAVTLTQLLSHRAGVSNDFLRDGLNTRMLFAKDAGKARTQAVEKILGWEPPHAPGSAFLYSNLGYMVAGCALEQAGGASCETLMRDWLFTPLGMESAGFGAPGDPKKKERPDQPWGHSAAGVPAEPGVLADNAAAMAPAGTIHVSLRDWAKFVQLHLRSVGGASPSASGR
jgi:CubicO group peptidase (beta-lactamase class C family)